MIVVMAYGYARRAGQPAPDLTGKSFGSPEMLKAMQDIAAAFEASPEEENRPRGCPTHAEATAGKSLSEDLGTQSGKS
jgi:hypothetical protein